MPLRAAESHPQWSHFRADRPSRVRGAPRRAHQRSCRPAARGVPARLRSWLLVPLRPAVFCPCHARIPLASHFAAQGGRAVLPGHGFWQMAARWDALRSRPDTSCGQQPTRSASFSGSIRASHPKTRAASGNIGPQSSGRSGRSCKGSSRLGEQNGLTVILLAPASSVRIRRWASALGARGHRVIVASWTAGETIAGAEVQVARPRAATRRGGWHSPTGGCADWPTAAARTSCTSTRSASTGYCRWRCHSAPRRVSPWAVEPRAARAPLSGPRWPGGHCTPPTSRYPPLQRSRQN